MIIARIGRGRPWINAGRDGAQMFSTIMFTYGLLTSFVLSGASRNNRLQRPHPRMLRYIGYILCGCSAGLSVLLLARVALHYASLS